MPIWALWRRNWAVWAIPLTVLILVTVNSNQSDWTDGYPVWAAAQKSYAVVLLGMVTALAGAAEGGYSPTQHRTDPVVCEPGVPEVCVWPEHVANRARIAANVRGITGLWRVAGIQLPDRLSEAAVGRQSPAEGALVYSETASDAQRAALLAQGLVQPCEQAEALEPEGGLGLFQVKDYLVRAAGFTDELTDPDELAKVLALPPDEQVELVNEYLGWARYC